MEALRAGFLAAVMASSLFCGGATSVTPAVDGGPSLDASAGETSPGGPSCGEPPPPAAGTFSSLGDTHAYAIDRFFMGDTEPGGSYDANAWKSIGFDLDGANTSDPEHSPNCAQENWRVLRDGNCGIDNGLGMFIGAAPPSNLSQYQTAQARTGQWTLLFQIIGHEAGASQTAVSGALYVGAPLAAPPKFDGTDVWPPTKTSAPEGAPLDAWADGYEIDGQLFVQDHFSVPFDIALGNGLRRRVAFQIRDIELSFAADGTSVTHGVLAGVILLADLGILLPSCAGGSSPSSYTDIVADGTVDASKPCDAMSFGIAFTAQAVHLGTPAEGLPEPGVCSGADGG